MLFFFFPVQPWEMVLLLCKIGLTAIICSRLFLSVQLSQIPPLSEFVILATSSQLSHSRERKYWKILENILYLYFTSLTQIISELYILYWLIIKWLRSSAIVPCLWCLYCILSRHGHIWKLWLWYWSTYSYGSFTIHNSP